MTVGPDPLQSLLNGITLPRWAPVRLVHAGEHLEDVAAAVQQAFLLPGVGDRIRPGARVALAAGSRGIDRIGEVMAAAVGEVRRRGGAPFLVPAMGSHGGATAEGQLKVLAHCGITEATVGCPIVSSLDVVELGRLESGETVFTDRLAATEADLVIPVNRVKPHTDFHGPVESGLLKMLAIGLGKQRGADTLHARGFESFPELVPAAGRLVLSRLPVPFGIALVENGYGQISLVEAIPGEAILEREPELLRLARSQMARLPVDRLDVLVVDQTGKDISGAGMDPNVLGRHHRGPLPNGPRIQRVVVLDLTEVSDGNAAGVGIADVCTARLAARMDRIKTYVNELTSRSPEGARLPAVGRSDREAILMAVASLRGSDPQAVRLMRIRNTRDLDLVWASEAVLLDGLSASGRAEVLGPARPILFDAEGNLAPDEHALAG